MEMRAGPRAMIEVAVGVALAFVLTSIWDLVAVRILPHDGTDKPIVISLALSFLVQAICVALLWQHRRRVAYGFLGYIGIEFLFILGGLTVFHRS